MNLNMILDYFEEYNEHELFYREYYEKKKDEKTFLDFLQSLDPQYVKENYLIVPELITSTVRTNLPMQEGDLCMISPAVEHSIFADGDSLVINILIRRSNIEDIFLTLCGIRISSPTF